MREDTGHNSSHHLFSVDGLSLPVPDASTTEVSIERLGLGLSPRIQEINDRHVRTLALTDPQSLPPIIVDRRSMRVVDGLHRLRAMQMWNMTKIQVRYVEGPDDLMFAWAVAANVHHGLPLTLQDRRHSAKRVIAAFPQVSDRGIAELTGLSPKTVAKLRDQSSEESPQLARVGQDGRLRPVNPASGRQRAKLILEEDPHASITEVADRAGVSRATARDVRNRLDRGEDPVLHRPHHTRKATAFDSNLASPTAMMRRLRQDPALRSSTAGRHFLQWLGTATPRGLDPEAVRAIVPPRCAGVLAALSRHTAQWWMQLAQTADELAKRTHGSGPAGSVKDSVRRRSARFG